MLLGIGGVRALRALHLPVEPLPLQRGPRGLRRARADRRPHGGGRRPSRGLAGGAGAHRLHHPHAGARGQRGAPARRPAPARRELRAGGRRDARDRRRPVQHDGRRAAPGALAPTPSPSSTARRRAPCGRTWTAPRPSSRSPTASTSAPGRTRAFPPALASDDSAPPGAHRRLKHELLAEVAARTGVRLDPDALTIGFARRAATYKRPDLILRDPERLAPLLKERRVQLVFAGKAHPADAEGKAVIALLIEPSATGRRQHRLPRQLRHGARPAPHARRGRLAQQAAPAAGGQRHLGHEGGHERRAEPLHPRRLVAGGLRARRDRLGHRRRQRGPGPGRPRPPRALRRPSRARSSRPSPTARAGRG